MWRRLQPYVTEAATLCEQAKELALAERAEEAKSAASAVARADAAAAELVEVREREL